MRGRAFSPSFPTRRGVAVDQRQRYDGRQRQGEEQVGGGVVGEEQRRLSTGSRQ